MRKPDDSIFVTLADGLAASVDGRGWNAQHDRARKLANGSPQLMAVVEELLAECANARDRGETIPDWLDMIEDHAIATRQEVENG